MLLLQKQAIVHLEKRFVIKEEIIERIKEKIEAEIFRLPEESLKQTHETLGQ